MEPFYFGPAASQLFGVFHPPAGAEGGCAVLLCQPWGHEYIQFHRALQQLAALLAAAGFPVLRFDFRGCGDSDGEAESGGTDAWREDIAAAVGELERRAGTTRVALAGLRLGGSLAALAAAGRRDVEAVVLWDPVLSGRAYLEELTRSHVKMLRYAHVKTRPHGGREILGFALPDHLVDDLGHLDLLALTDKPAPRVLVVESNPNVQQEALRRHLAGLGATVAHQQYSNPHLWVWIEDFGKVHVPRRIIQAVVSWLSEECA